MTEAKKQFVSLFLAILLVVVYFAPIHLSLADEPRHGGTLIVGIKGEPSTLNPSLTAAYLNIQFLCPMFETLVNYDDQLNPVPNLVTSWEVSSDSKKYTFHLLQNCTWHDGVQFTSADVKFSIEQVLLPLLPHASNPYGNLDHVETPDNYTVILYYNTSRPFVMKYLGHMYSGIIPKHLYEGTDILTNPHNLEPVGNGAFKFQEYVKGDHLTLVKNDDYFRSDRPYLDKIIFRIFPDTETMLLALEEGEINYIPTFLALEANDRLKGNADLQMLFVPLPQYTMETVYFNQLNPILANVTVRKAIAHAINRTAMLDTLTYGLYNLAEGPFFRQGATAWIFDDRPAVTWPYEYNVTKANMLLDQAGYPKDTDGWRFTVRHCYSTHRAIWVSEAFLVKDFLEAVGIKVNLEAYDFSTWLDKVFTKWDWDMTYSTMAAGGPDPIEMHMNFAPNNHVKAPWTNAMAWNNTRAQEIFDLAGVESNWTKRAELYYELDQLMSDDVVGVFMFERVSGYAWSKEFVGLPAGPWGWDTHYQVYSTAVTAPPSPFPWEVVAAVAVGLVVVAGAGVFYWNRRRKVHK